MAKTGDFFEELAGIISRLRDPQGGCPWDLEQTHESLKQYLVEETYEVIDAIDTNKPKLKEELGDVLLQVMLHSQIGKDEGTFTIDDVVSLLSKKLVKRHPHVFGDVEAKTAGEVLKNWEAIKQQDLKKDESVLDGVPKSMPALLKAQRIGTKASRVGFDWADAEGVSEKVKEEVGEFLEALSNPKKDKVHAAEEFGDLLFSLAQLSRKMDLNAEDLLNQASQKFERRFRALEKITGGKLKDLSPEELDAHWNRIKSAETQ